MKQRITPVTLRYMMITAAFWMAFCIISTYAAVFLKGIGYTNQELGLILAAGCLGGSILGPLLGAWIDRNRRVKHATVVYGLLALQAVMLLLLRFNPHKGVLSAVCYALYITFLMPVNAINLDMDLRLEHAGLPLNFGLARSMGSFAFVIISTLLGLWVEASSFLVIPWAALGIVAFQALGNTLIARDLKIADASPSAQITEKEKSSSLPAFIRQNKAFCLMLFGTILIYIAHNTDGNFLIDLVENVGGTESTLGLLAAFTAIVEVPVMMFSARLPSKWPKVAYIRFAFIMFVFKTLAYALAPNIPLLFAARMLQAPSYALYTVLVVSYADQVVPRRDSAKAQSLVYSMTTIGSVLASLLGGRMFDVSGVKPTMLAASAVCAVGAVIAVLATFMKGMGGKTEQPELTRT